MHTHDAVMLQGSCDISEREKSEEVRRIRFAPAVEMKQVQSSGSEVENNREKTPY